jgi:hypothetical protein
MATIQQTTKETTKETIPWTHDVDKALEEARTKGLLVLIDFSAAPA